MTASAASIEAVLALVPFIREHARLDGVGATLAGVGRRRSYGFFRGLPPAAAAREIFADPAATSPTPSGDATIVARSSRGSCANSRRFQAPIATQ
jgi:hypothetical protein